MNGSKVAQLILVTTLVVGAFFLGRNSAGTAKEDSAPPKTPPRQKRLSAITSTSPDKPVPGAPTRSENSLPASTSHNELGTAKIISDFLANAAESISDEAESDLADVIAEWLAHYPESAIAWLASGERRNEALVSIFYIWGLESPDDAHAWLSANQNMAGYDFAASGLASRLDYEEALGLADTVSDPKIKLHIWREKGDALYEIDQDELRQRLNSSGIPEEAHPILIEQWKTDLRNSGKRNAQNLASVYSSAVAAGATFEGQTIEQVIDELVAGVNGANSFSTTTFQVPNMSRRDINRSLRNLQLNDNGSLSYSPNDTDEL